MKINNYDKLLDHIINNGIAAATKDYTDPKDQNRLEGSIAGFETCRNKLPEELIEIYSEGGEYANKAFTEHDSEKYWWFRCYQLEVEWVCNVVSALLILEDHSFKPLLSWLPTVNGMSQALQIKFDLKLF